MPRTLDEMLNSAADILDKTGKFVLFPMYWAGVWPFEEVGENVYHPRQWIDESIAPSAEGPGTVWHVNPFIKFARDKAGKRVSIPKIVQTNVNDDLNFVTGDNLTGMIDVQHAWRIQTREDADKFYWNLGSFNKMNVVEEIVVNKVNDVIQTKEWLKEGVIPSPYERAKIVNELNDTRDSKSIYSMYGVFSDSIAISEPRPDAESAKILQITADADQRIRETERIATATEQNIEKYVRAARKRLGIPEGRKKLTPSERRDMNAVISEMYQADNTQQIAALGAKPFIVTSPLPVRYS